MFLVTLPIDQISVMMPSGSLSIFNVVGDDPDGHKLAKMLFECSRTSSDMSSHFDPAVHTLESLQAGISGHVPIAVIREATEDELPSSRIFREAWEDQGSAVGVNMPKARTIHMDDIRAERNKELAAKDITFMRSVEDADTDAQATIKAEKQTLRDIPATFDITTGVDTPEQLKAKWPTELPERE